MLKFLVLSALTIVLFIQTAPAYCGITRTFVYHLTVRLPEHVMADANAIAEYNSRFNPFLKNPYQNQLVQIQTVIRNNKTIRLASIVVP